MPKQINYVQQIPVNPKSFPISRIAESETDTEIIQGRVPGGFGFSDNDNIEMHFYDSTNKLVGSVIIPVSTRIISIRSILLPNNEKEEKILIDMTRVQKELGLLIPPGNYTVALNLFSNEIGSYTNKKLVIEQVSLSRTEVRLGFNGGVSEEDEFELTEFADSGIPRLVAAGALESIMGVGEGKVLTDTETANTPQMQAFVEKVTRRLLEKDIQILAAMEDLESGTMDNFRITVETLSVEVYSEFVRLLTLTKNARQYDRLQYSDIEALLTRAVDTALTNSNINAYTSGQIQYV